VPLYDNQRISRRSHLISNGASPLSDGVGNRRLNRRKPHPTQIQTIGLLTLCPLSDINPKRRSGVYSVREAAAKLGVTDRHVRLLLARGGLSGKRLGHDWVVLSLDYERKRKPKRKKREVAGNELGQKPDEVWMEGSL